MARTSQAPRRVAQPRERNEDSGRTAIMDVAERLFAERGIDAVSLRTINAEAGYSVAALHYHFGTRDGLIHALLERAQPPMLERRAAMIAELNTLAHPPLRRIVAALVEPLTVGLVEQPSDSLRRLRFLARLYFDRSPHMARVLEDSLELFMPLLRKALPGLDEPLLRRRWIFAAELAQHALANTLPVRRQHGAEAPPGAAELESFVRELIDFIAGGLRAAR